MDTIGSFANLILDSSMIPKEIRIVRGTNTLPFITSTLWTPDLKANNGNVFKTQKKRKTTEGVLFFTIKKRSIKVAIAKPSCLLGINE